MATKWEDCSTEALLTPRVRHIINLAAARAARRGDGQVEDVDLLNAIIDEGAGRASQLVQGLLALQDKVEELVARLQSPQASNHEAP